MVNNYKEEMKLCKDGRIWGQNNKEASNHLGFATGKKTSKGDYIKKGYNPNSAIKKGFNSSKNGGMLLKGKKAPMYGVHRFGKNNPNWKGGINSLKDGIRHLPEYVQWRSDVFQRDGWICQTCGKKSGGDLEAHHKKSFAKIVRDNNITTLAEAQMCEELWKVNNGITLCEECHKLTQNKRRNNA